MVGCVAAGLLVRFSNANYREHHRQTFSRIGLPRAAYFVALAGVLIVGVLLPDLQNLWLRRVETKTVPELLKRYTKQKRSIAHANRTGTSYVMAPCCLDQRGNWVGCMETT